MSGGWWSPGPRIVGSLAPKVTAPDLTLDGDVESVTFARSLLRSTLVLLAAAPVAAYLVHVVARRIRVRWNADTVVIDPWPAGSAPAHRLARADVVAVRCGKSELGVRLASGQELWLVDGRRVVRGDLERGRELAYRLGIPIVDDSGATVALPTARVR